MKLLMRAISTSRRRIRSAQQRSSRLLGRGALGTVLRGARDFVLIERSMLIQPMLWRRTAWV